MDSTWRVRRALIADAEELAELAAATFPSACPPGFDEAAIARHIRQRLSADAFRINLADAALEYTLAITGDGRAAGYLALSDAPPPRSAGSGLLELKQIYVRSQEHGSGIGHALMEVACSRAAERGFAGLWLGTSKQNERAIAFYERHGFAIRGERTFLVDDLPNEDWVLTRVDPQGPA